MALEIDYWMEKFRELGWGLRVICTPDSGTVAAWPYPNGQPTYSEFSLADTDERTRRVRLREAIEGLYALAQSQPCPHTREGDIIEEYVVCGNCGEIDCSRAPADSEVIKVNRSEMFRRSEQLLTESLGDVAGFTNGETLRRD